MSQFKNGAFVSRLFGDNSGEVLAEFQHFAHAVEFSKAHVADKDNRGSWFLVATDCYSGKTELFYPISEESA